MRNHQKVGDNNTKKIKVFKRKVLIRWFRRKVSNLIRRFIRAMNNFLADLEYVDYTPDERVSRNFEKRNFEKRYRKDPAFRDRFKGDVNSKRKFTKVDDKPTIQDKKKNGQIKDLEDKK
jgi:hypothetical protein